MSAEAAAGHCSEDGCIGDFTPVAGPVDEIDLIGRIDRVQASFEAFRREALTPPDGTEKAAEWLLDNDYHVARALREVVKGLPRAYLAKLPGAPGEDTRPRPYAIARDYFRCSHLQLSCGEFENYIGKLQKSWPLSLAELWALPNMLRIVAIETLLAALAELFGGGGAKQLDSWLVPPDPRSVHAVERVARSITVLRTISEIAWGDFVDAVSIVERTLQGDPALAYPRMDFETRDRYRGALEQIAADAGRPEQEVAQEVLTLTADAQDPVRRHVGYWLLDRGREALETRLGAAIPWNRRAGRVVLAHPWAVYACLGLGLWVAFMVTPALFLHLAQASPLAWLGGLLLAVIPSSILAMVTLNGVLTRFLPPRILPKMDYTGGLPASARTAVVVPVILSPRDDRREIAHVLEQHWLANIDRQLSIVLLADPADADLPHKPGDTELVDGLIAEIERLNARYATEGHEPFHLLMRPRRFNAAEKCWMAWERKRGKLEQFNTLVATGDTAAFAITVGPTEALHGLRYVVTLDADTMLSAGSVARLVAAIDHPLNRPCIDPDTRLPRRGHAIVQPRIEISPQSGERSLFARLFTGDTAIDIYSRAVSDVYQDLFGWGVFVGKGIYEVDAFRACLADRVPENAILSHDLFEGAFCRAALASDIVLYENFPASYSEYARRLHRWIRGDWQLLPWLGPRVPSEAGACTRNPFAAVDRWKLLDNLRRSLVAPSLLALAIAGWLVLPGSPLAWTLLVVFAHSGQLLIELATGMARGRRKGAVRGLGGRIEDNAGRAALAIAFLCHEALVSAHAIALTLGRLLVTRHRLLQWTTAAGVARTQAGDSPRRCSWREMWPASLVALGIAGIVLHFRPAALPTAAILLVPWILAPEIARWLVRPAQPEARAIDAAGLLYLRRLARRTWLYFETFAGPADHWLPPDNYQGPPFEEIAHRTSPTNIGMLLTSTATAWDLGFIGRAELEARSENLLDTLDRLPRYRGHFYNWYNTRDLVPLEPRYVSVVDSGNLAVAMIAYAATLREAGEAATLEPQRWLGLRDLLDLVAEAVAFTRGEPLAHEARALGTAIADCVARGDDPLVPFENEWRQALGRLAATGEHLLADPAALDPARRTDLRSWLERLDHHLRELTRDASVALPHGTRMTQLAQAYERLAWAMDFAWLYDANRDLLYLGYNASLGRIDTHHYDLLASEARLASLLAIAKRDLPVRHWFHLGRPVVRRARDLLIQSWNGSMFEYLMPRLFLPSERNTLVGRSEAAAAALQRRYGERNGLPWGVSESAYALRDAENRFQYRAFGVPDLGMRRGLAEDAVIAPYATALALAVDPPAAVANLQAIDRLGAGSRFGLYEALDFTPGRIPDGRRFAPVNAAMAHHQGMILGAIGNALCGDCHARRFMRHPRVATVALLLSERVPYELPSEISRLEVAQAGSERRTPARAPVRWRRRARPWPQGVLLANGRLSSWISDRGPAALRWQGYAINRFAGDPLVENAGPAFYVKDRKSQRLLAMGAGRDKGIATASSIGFASDGAEFHASDQQLEATMEIALAQDHDLEIRRITLRNEAAHERDLLLSWYAEPVLSRAIEDERHPVFNRLFVSGRFLDAPAGMLFTRRPRTPQETPPSVLYTLVDANGPARGLTWSSDRRAFLGRNRDLRDPQGAHRQLPPDDLSGLDAACVLQLECRLQPGEERQFDFLTLVGGSAETVESVAQTLRTPAAIGWLLHQGRAGCSPAHDGEGLSDAELIATQELGMMLAFGHPALTQRDPAPPAQGGAQSDLWGMGISGDLPIVLLEVEGEGGELPEVLVRAHRQWRLAGLESDLVLLQTAGSGYLEPLREQLSTLLHAAGSAGALGARGGVHLLFSDQLGEARTRQLKGTATACLVENEGSLASQLERAANAGHLPIPPIIASRPPLSEPAAAPRSTRAEVPLFELGEAACAIALEAHGTTPAPWANVLANPDFGTLVTEAGGGFTWSVNSGEHRLTSWTNDPVGDRVSEALYLRDEETAQLWSIAPAPCGADIRCEVRHAQGWSSWHARSHGLDQRMTVTVPPDDTVKLIHVELRNLTDRPRRLTATYYVEWLLGALASTDRRHIRCEFADAPAALLAANPWREDFAERVAFLAASRPAHGYCVDRGEFLGEDGDPARPEALRRWGLHSAIPASYQPCGAYQLHLELAPGETVEACFVLGDAAGRSEALAKVARWTTPGMARQARADASAFWDRLADTLQVETPDPRFDLMVNRWLPYQALSSRIFGRCGFYQASGAYGFRDQLQDVLALLYARPTLAREQILRCARHQFEQGDVLHWWHPPAGRGVRTRFSDDLHWLAYAVGTYVEATGDESILTESVDFLAAPPLADDESDRYDRFPPADNPAPIIDHCERALERIATGAHGLPLIGAGDWNDGMDRLGIAGHGESVWLAWFVSEVMELHANMLTRLARGDQARHWQARAATIRAAAREHGWDGQWFRRAYDDRGNPLGSVGNSQCAIDSIAQSWARFALGEDPRAERALDSAWNRLLDGKADLLRLLWPPFRIDGSDPGYIASYPPGVRENGGQYNHAAAWLGLAFAAAGDGDRAYRVFTTISPAHRSADPVSTDRYRIEPYCVAGDIATEGARRGRGGWSWYTGAAAWSWRLAVEGILGLHLEEGALALAPCLPSGWSQFSARITRDGGTIVVLVETSQVSHPAMTIDGQPAPWRPVAFPPRGRTVEVRLRLPAAHQRAASGVAVEQTGVEG